MLASQQQRSFSYADAQSKRYKGPSYKSFQKMKSAMGHSETVRDERAAYEAEMKKRMETRLNWGIKDRWEQRELDSVIKNRDVRAA